MGEAFRDFTDSEHQLTPQEFQACADRLTQQICNYDWLPVSKPLVGIELQILAEINCCRVRGLTRRQNTHIFNQESSWIADNLAAHIQRVITRLVDSGLPKSEILINSYIRG
jgi:hypothetical protein